MSSDDRATAAATFCATLADEWVRSGITHAFVAPGSRSTPLALALAERRELEVLVCHDERVAAFGALGRGKATGVPAVVLCSSGTAGAHFLAAIAEADLSSVPLIACTADRPPHLWQVGAPQVMNQTGLYGTKVRYFAEPGVPDAAASRTWRPLASRVVAEAAGWSGRSGPVHLNLSFDEPLTATPAVLPPARVQGQPWSRAVRASHLDAFDLDVLFERLADAESGVVVAGEGAAAGRDIVAVADGLGWPLLADHQSGARHPGSVTHYESLLRVESFAHRVRPEVILRLGVMSSSKALANWTTWCAEHGTEVLAITNGSWIDPQHLATELIGGDGVVAGLAQRAAPPQTPPTASVRALTDLIIEADRRAGLTVAEPLVARRSEPQVVADAYGSVPRGGALVVGSSMPIRHLEWFVPGRAPSDDVAVFSNRGVNGIDGVISTAIGVASTRPTVVVVGDVSFLHDATALTALARRGLDLTIVVIDNDGGGIFGFLPQHEQLDRHRFEQLFGTPHGTDLLALAAAHGIASVEWDTWIADTQRWRGTPTVVVARTNRDAVLGDLRALHEAVATSLR